MRRRGRGEMVREQVCIVYIVMNNKATNDNEKTNVYFGHVHCCVTLR